MPVELEERVQLVCLVVGIGDVKAGAPLVLDWKALPSASLPGTVRLLLEQRLAGRGLLPLLGGRADDLYLATSELLTNACKETPYAEIHYRSTFGRHCVWIGVWDSSDRIPGEPAFHPDWPLALLEARDGGHAEARFIGPDQ
ncbi:MULTISPECIES: ATP-binding protein [Actinomadura]|uniref:ATP-binding protein n=1 Tax=Actinomadura yumaensis TaxID=111807 RepID=A0ABW2CEU7_9ACTN|nr:ATP-binding protein [Actinomadura sp. J1-007]MWK35549.1 hypothetical protein [Actinomadura sp. J1-007]